MQLEVESPAYQKSSLIQRLAQVPLDQVIDCKAMRHHLSDLTGLFDQVQEGPTQENRGNHCTEHGLSFEGTYTYEALGLSFENVYSFVAFDLTLDSINTCVVHCPSFERLLVLKECMHM